MANENKVVKVPTAKGIGSAFKDFGIGAIAGLGLAVAYSVFGSLGFLAAPLLIGSMIKSDNAKVVTTITGVLLGLALLGGGLGGTSKSNGASEAVM